MEILQLYSNSPLRNFSYLMASDSGKEVFCVDPYDGESVYNVLQSKKWLLKAIINTHEHHDHHCGNAKLQELTGCEIWSHYAAKTRIQDVDRELRAEDKIYLGEDYLQVLETPGHTMAHICLLAYKKAGPFAIFTGDTLFNAGVGHCHSGGDPKILFKTINEQFSALDDEILVYPGHEYMQKNLGFSASVEPKNTHIKPILELYADKLRKGSFLINSMGVERKINSFLRAKDEATFLELRNKRNQW